MLIHHYRKSVPGKFDFFRRYAIYFGVGQISSLDKSKEFDSIAYSIGINLEVQKGFGINGGYALYSYKDVSSTATSSDFNTNSSFTFGITLSSELWKNLFNFK